MSVHQSSPLVQSSHVVIVFGFDCTVDEEVDLLKSLFSLRTRWRICMDALHFSCWACTIYCSSFQLILENWKLPDWNWEVLFRSQRTRIFGDYSLTVISLLSIISKTLECSQNSNGTYICKLSHQQPSVWFSFRSFHCNTSSTCHTFITHGKMCSSWLCCTRCC